MTTAFMARIWEMLIESELSALVSLASFAQDTRVIEFYVETLAAERFGTSLQYTHDEEIALPEVQESGIHVVLFGEGTPIEKRAARKYAARSEIINPITDAVATFLRQTLVVAVTYMEIVVEEFLRAAFTARPQTMYEYLNPLAEHKGKLDLKEVLEAESKEALLGTLALRSAKLVGRSQLRFIAKTILRVTGQALDPELVDRLERLTLRRNKLVHELDEVDVTTEEAKDALMTVLDLVEQLRRLARAVAIPVDVIRVSV